MGGGLYSHDLEAVTITASLPYSAPTRPPLHHRPPPPLRSCRAPSSQPSPTLPLHSSCRAKLRRLDKASNASRRGLQLHLVAGGEPGPELAPLMPRLVQRRGRSSER